MIITVVVLLVILVLPTQAVTWWHSSVRQSVAELAGKQKTPAKRGRARSSR